MALTITHDGASLNHNAVIRIPGNASATKKFNIVDGAAPGAAFTIEAGAPVMIDKVEGNLNAQGTAEIIVGPSFGAKGDVSLTVKVGNVRKSFQVRFH